MAYDPQISRIVAMDQVLKNYQQDFDMVKAAEMHYERMRTLNNTTLIQLDIQKSIGNILGSLSIDTIWNNPGGRIVDAALSEARAGVLSRAVGPLEGLPVEDYIQDATRAKNVISHTQVGAEHRLIAKLVQMQGYTNDEGRHFKNRLTPQNSPGENPTSYALLDDVGFILSTNIPEASVVSTQEQSAAKNNARFHTNKSQSIVNENGATKEIYNQYNVDTQYTTSVAQPVDSSTFNFKIKNMASGWSRSFPAHISNFNEAVSTTWNNISLINRSEDIYIYQRAERSFNLEFVIFASAENITPEIESEDFNSTITISTGNGNEEVGVMSKEMMWDRINFLHRLSRPEYSTKGTFNKAPYCKLWIADLFKGIRAIIESVNINYDPLLWDINENVKSGQVKPMIAMITLSGKFLHDISPSAYTDFYKDFSNEI